MVIRPVKKTLTVVSTTVVAFTMIPPGGDWTWQSVRVANYSPWVVRLANTSSNNNNPPQLVMPFQQNIYQFDATQGPILCTVTWQAVTPETGYYVIAEFCDTFRGFPGVYPVPLALGGSASGSVTSVTGTSPIKATPTHGAVVLSWLPTASVSMATQALTHLPTPVASTQAANKGYVDSVAQGLDAKTSATVVSTINVVALTGVQTIDGVVLIATNRVLLTAQTTAKLNGLWVVNAGAWTRPVTFATGSTQQGAYVLIEEGTVNAGTAWVLTGTAVVVGTTNETWVKFSNATSVTMGGDVTGASSASTVAKIQGHAVTSAAPTTGEIYIWTTSGSKFVPKAQPQIGVGSWVTGYYYGTKSGTTATTTPLTKGKIYFVRFEVSVSFTAKQLYLYIVAGVATTTVRFGIYADNGHGKPGAKVLDAGTVASTASTTGVGITVTHTLTPGVYWLCVVRQGTSAIGTLKGPQTTTTWRLAQNWGTATVPTFHGFFGWVSTAATFTSTLPATAPALTAITSAANMNGIMVKSA